MHYLQEHDKSSTRRTLRSRLAAYFQKVKSEHASPTQLGVGIGVGVFCGCSPFHGLQFLLALGLIWLFRLNKLAVMLGLQISMPPISPFVIFAGLQTGELVRFRRFLPLSPHQIREVLGSKLWEGLLIDFILGSLIFGFILGLTFGTATTFILRRRQRLAPAEPPA